MSAASRGMAVTLPRRRRVLAGVAGRATRASPPGLTAGAHRRPAKLRFVLGVGLACAAWGSPRLIEGQVTVTPSVFVAYVAHQVDIGYGTELTSGPVLGLAVDVSPTRWTDVTLSGYEGTLASGSPTVDSRRMADIELGGSIFANPVLALQVGFQAQSYTTALARQQWFSMVVGGEYAPLLLDGVGRAVLRLGLLPVVTVSGLPDPTFGATGSAGFELLRGPVTGSVFFTLERYNFPLANGSARAEQLELIGVNIGVKFPR